MAVTPIDPPGPLSSFIERLDFLVDNLVGLVIAVDHSDAQVKRPVELVFADGVFLYPYLGSTVVGNALSILRQGGWSYAEQNKLRFFEQPVLSGGQGWGSIYDLNLTELPTQTLVNGANTVDGLTWWSKGNAGFVDAVVNNVLNGAGMECGSAAYSITGDYGYRTPWFPFAQIEDYNPDAPVAVAWRWSGTGLSSTNYMVGGLASMANNGTQWLSAERASAAFVKYEGATNQLVHYIEDGVGLTPKAITPSAGTPGGHAFVEARLASQIFTSAHAAFAGTLPVNIHALTSGLNPRVDANARSNLGFFFTRNRSTAFTCYLTHLSVLQPRVAA